MQFDYLEWFGKNILYLFLVIGAIIVASLARAFFVRSQYRDLKDSDNISADSYERMDAGIKLSNDDDDP